MFGTGCLYFIKFGKIYDALWIYPLKNCPRVPKVASAEILT